MNKGLIGLFILVVLFVIFWPSPPDQEAWLGLIVGGAFVLILIYFLVAKTRRKPPEDIPRSPSETSLPKKNDNIDLTP